MYSEDIDNAAAMDRNGDDVYSRPVRAGKRTYFFDVKATKGNDYYLTITFEKFSQGLEEVIAFIKEKCPIPVVERTMDEDRSNPAPREESGSNFSNVDFEEL